jgi:hypothetical protein
MGPDVDCRSIWLSARNQTLDTEIQASMFMQR